VSTLITLKAFLRNLVLPPAGPLLLALVGLLLWRWRPRVARITVAIGVLTLWVLATPLLANALERVAQRAPPLDLARPVNAEAIVVLGGGERRDAAPEYGGGGAADGVLLERLTYAAYLHRRTGLPVLVSGNRMEAVTMGAVLARSFDIQPRWIDDRAEDTFQNAANSSRLLSAAGIRRVAVVTSASHAWRAAQEFRATGLQVLPAPVGLWAPAENGVLSWVPDLTALARSHDALYELVGETVRELLAVSRLRRQRDAGSAINGR
jgi:uncharacterized SAM-binding protein YcdF (DUF218 family)